MLTGTATSVPFPWQHLPTISHHTMMSFTNTGHLDERSLLAIAWHKAQPVQMAPWEMQCLSIHASSEKVPSRGCELQGSSPAPPAHPLFWLSPWHRGCATRGLWGWLSCWGTTRAVHLQAMTPCLTKWETPRGVGKCLPAHQKTFDHIA